MESEDVGIGWKFGSKLVLFQNHAAFTGLREPVGSKRFFENTYNG